MKRITADFSYLGILFQNNPLYMLCTIVYLVFGALFLGGRLFSWIITILIYVISICVVFSTLGEKVLRFVEDVRPLYTKREKEYLLPIFSEVYQEARRKNPLLRIELCVIDQMYVNACALGQHTIAVTKGAMETFSEDELKAILCHEIGHIAHMDTVASLYLLVGQGYFSILILILKFIITLCERVIYSLTRNGLVRLIMSGIRAVFQLFLFAYMLAINLTIAVGSRSNEYRADTYSFMLGYGQEMVEALYLLEKINLSEKNSVIKKMLASHPILPKRIANVERLIDESE